MLKIPFFENLPAALVFDLDGTLLNNRLEISPRTRIALERCLDKGFPVIVATSRAERSVIRRFDQDLFKRCSMVLSNGALARGVHPLGGHVDFPMPPDLALAVVRLILEIEPSTQITVEIMGLEFGMNRRPDAATLWAVNSSTPEMLLSMEQAIARSPRKIAAGGLGKELTGLVRALNEKFGGRIEVIPSNDCSFLNIVMAGVSKSKALAALLISGDIALKDVMAFGDDYPDLDMLTACGYSVAMANASPEIKAAAKFQTLSNNEEGVAVVLERMLNII
jgi:hydroxymethylpyrimidine pyrophosphatase-like HAD family hydrolase